MDLKLRLETLDFLWGQIHPFYVVFETSGLKIHVLLQTIHHQQICHDLFRHLEVLR